MCWEVKQSCSSTITTHTTTTRSISDDKEEHRRERNRRHARETRLRKKEYIENLKAQLAEVTDKKNALEKEVSWWEDTHARMCVVFVFVWSMC